MDGSFGYTNKIAKNGQGHFWLGGSHVTSTSAPASANELLTGWGEQRVPVTSRRQRQPAALSAAVLIASMFAR